MRVPRILNTSLRWAVVLVLMGIPLALVTSAQAVPTRSPGRSLGTSTPPNIVIFVSDDQAEGTLDAMPALRAGLVAQGVTLNGLIPTSLCCPSRAALLSGRYARSTDVYRNISPHGGWSTFNQSGDEERTIAVALHDAGYSTGLFGKYLNGYGGLSPAGYVPPGWDQFRAIYDPAAEPSLASGAYYDYFLRGTGEDVWYDSSEQSYSTDVITGLSVDFLQTAPADKPLFLYYSSFGPHKPWTPAPRDIGSWHDEPLNPAAVTLTQNRPDFLPDITVPYEEWQANQRAEHEALMSVDDGVSSIIQALGDRASNTLFVYLSDNGLQFGEHGLENKNYPYSGSTNVPMYLRWDGVIAAGSKDRTPMTNADLTATIAEAANVTMPNLDGVSFFAPERPTGVTLEAIKGGGHPAYCGYRSARYVYVEYDDGMGTEFYDYKRDPNELVNAVSLHRYADLVAQHRALARTTCSPTPPRFNWR